MRTFWFWFTAHEQRHFSDCHALADTLTLVYHAWTWTFGLRYHVWIWTSTWTFWLVTHEYGHIWCFMQQCTWAVWVLIWTGTKVFWLVTHKDALIFVDIYPKWFATFPSGVRLEWRVHCVALCVCTVWGVQLLAVLPVDEDCVCHLHDPDAHPAAEHAHRHDGQHLQPGHRQVGEGVAQTGTSNFCLSLLSSFVSSSSPLTQLLIHPIDAAVHLACWHRSSFSCWHSG